MSDGSGTGNGSVSPAELHARIGRTRESLDRTIDALAERLDPAVLRRAGTRRVKQKTRSAAAQARTAAVDHKAALALGAAAIVLFVKRPMVAALLAAAGAVAATLVRRSGWAPSAAGLPWGEDPRSAASPESPAAP